MAKKKRSSGGGSGKKLPLNQSIPLGIQHVLAMFAGNITVPIIIAGIFGLILNDPITSTASIAIFPFLLTFYKKHRYKNNV